MDDLKANTEYTGYTGASSVVQWFWEVVKSFSKEDMARLLQFVTGTSKVVTKQNVASIVINNFGASLMLLPQSDA